MSNIMKTAEEFLSVRFRESDYGVLAVGLLHHPFLPVTLFASIELLEIYLTSEIVKEISMKELAFLLSSSING